MSAYIDIGVKRVQDYLARSRHLWGRRGASAELVELLAASQVEKQLSGHPGVTRNPEAATVDGVISIYGYDSDATLAAARDVVRAARPALPGVTLEVSAHLAAGSYAETLAGDAHPEVSEIYLPAPLEYPPGCICVECGLDAAIGRFKVQDELLRLCADCSRRVPDPTRKPSVVDRMIRRPDSPSDSNGVHTQLTDDGVVTHFAAESRLLAALNEDRTAGFEVRGVRDFTDLARRTWSEQSAGRTIRDNHIATIFADGNRLGALFQDAREEASASGDLASLQALSAAVKKATFGALVAATREITQDDERVLPVVPHLLGGDDLLLSVSADRAWQFANAFINNIQAGMAEIATPQIQPTMSLGMVICHASFPFGDQIRLAEQALRKAKEQVFGDGWSFTWLDVTWEGPTPVAERHPWLVSELRERDRALRAFAALPNSGLEAMRRAIDVDDPRVGWLRLQHLGERMPGCAAALQALFGAQLTSAIPDGAPTLIRDMLSLGRWWRS